MVSELVCDPLFVRALGVTTAMAGVFLGRVSVLAAAGARRWCGVAIACPLILVGALLVVMPTVAEWFHRTDHADLVPWVLSVPTVMALLLSRWRVR